MSRLIWIVVLLAATALNVAFVVEDVSRWQNSAAAGFAAACVMWHVVLWVVDR